MALIFTPYYYICLFRSFRLVLSFDRILTQPTNPPTAQPPQPTPPHNLATLTPYIYTPKNQTPFNISPYFLCPKIYYTENETTSHFLFSNPKSKTISDTKTDLYTQRAGGSRIGISTQHTAHRT